MPWIDAPHEDLWDDELAELKDRVIDPKWKRVDWVLRIHALDAGSMNAHDVLYQQAMRSTKTLRKVEREMIAVVVSQINECHY
ncbi:MAG: carboxymuconolactone decarboxylase family protein [Acidimicrobiia bacterium]|nr:carboxymuconolactone decarboxylase family protein [Acidimicrobiia bacterium]MDH3464233.1 carboxymuconolactone decarboxylase family protein [Acidimicrobiia bacterium]